MTDSGSDPTDRPPPNRHTRLNEIRAAFVLLTRLPLPGSQATAGQAGAAIWAFPLVGAVVGLVGGLVFLAANRAGVGIGSATLLAVAAQVLLTGALHEDGLADTADGFGGGRDREHKLAIMRDSRIGSYGVIALVLAFGLRYTAINELANSLISTSDEYDQTVSHISAVIIALMAGGTVSRAAMALVWQMLPPARSDGLAVSGGGAPFPAAISGIAIAAGLTFLLLPIGSWAAVLAAVALVAVFMMLLAKQQIGGHTGDVLGATQQVTEIAALLAITAATIAI